MAKRKKRLIRQVRQAIFGSSEPWNIHVPAAAAIQQIATELESGSMLSETECRERLGVRSESPTDVQRIGSVAIIPVVGPIFQRSTNVSRYYGGAAQDTLRAQIRQCIDSTEVKAIVGYYDTPGGAALGNQETVEMIREVRGTKPMIAFCDGLMASAGYYLGAAFDKIIATPSSMIGSIGTIWMHANFRGMYEEFGIDISVLTNIDSPRKSDGNPYVALEGDARKSMQSLIDDYGSQFITSVATDRGQSYDRIVEQYGQGQVFIATEAKSRGMLDGIVADVGELIGSVESGSLSGVAAQSVRIPQQTTSPVVSIASTVGAAASNSSRSSSVARPQQTTEESKQMEITPRIKAMLFACGLIAASDAEDAVCIAAITAHFRARGTDVPSDEQAVIDGLSSTTSVLTSTATPAANVQQAHDSEFEEARLAARQEGSAQERERIEQIRASATTLQSQGLELTEEQITEAINSNTDANAIAANWLNQLGTQSPETPVQSITVNETGLEAWAQDSLLSLANRFGLTVRNDAGESVPQNAQSRQLSRAPMIHLASECLRLQGGRVDPYADNESIALQAMQMGDAMHRVDLQGSGGGGLENSSAQRAGDFPTLLGNFVDLLIDDAIEQADMTYDKYTSILPGDLPNFHAIPIGEVGVNDELDEIFDKRELESSEIKDELTSHLFLREFGRKIDFTPRMAANDRLDQFVPLIRTGLGEAWENTQNRLCLALVTSQLALLDGHPLFDADHHGNVLAAGAAPSSVQMDKLDQLGMAQKTVAGRGRMRTPYTIALVPPKHKRAAQQAFWDFSRLPEMKQATTTSGLDTHRGIVEPILEPELADFDPDAWYGLANPNRRAAIVRAYFRGWGAAGKRQRYYKPETKCTVFDFEGRVGVAVRNYRYIAKNPGQ